MKLISRFSVIGGRFRAFACFVLGVTGIAAAGAVAIPIDLGTPPIITSEIAVPFQELNGTQLTGQTLPLNFTFSNDEFVRLFTITSTLFESLITLQTNSSDSLGFLGGTGYLIDGQGMAIPGFGVTGSASGNGSLAIGLFPLLKDIDGTPNTDLVRPLDFYGFHFDLKLADAGDLSIHVTMGTLSLLSETGAPFGIGPHVPRDIVPEIGNTLFLLAISLAALIFARTTRLAR